MNSLILEEKKKNLLTHLASMIYRHHHHRRRRRHHRHHYHVIKLIVINLERLENAVRKGPLYRTEAVFNGSHYVKRCLIMIYKAAFGCLLAAFWLPFCFQWPNVRLGTNSLRPASGI